MLTSPANRMPSVIGRRRPPPISSAWSAPSFSAAWPSPRRTNRQDCFMAVIPLCRILALWAAQQPDRIAVAHGDQSLTWAQLDARTNRLARAYEKLGVCENDFVTIGLP